MIVAMHVATGAAAGTALGSRRRAVVAGVALHGACDAVPHEDIESLRFELVSGAALLALVAAAQGPFSPSVIGALASCSPDLEHVLRLPQPRGEKLFPTHRFATLHRSGGVPAWLQLVAAGAIVGALVTARAGR